MKKDSYTELKKFMNKATDVHHWNQLRELAKDEVPLDEIGKLDASGYIKIVLKK